ncbi:MAG: hypothetical protein DRN30_04550 [Thermoplasmata archaeon]|nr:MAG: hypothetical protein DRN30_04550 [Thermoplasmata archaeon]
MFSVLRRVQKGHRKKVSSGRKLGIITKDFALYYKAYKLLSERGIPVYHGLPGDPIPLDVGIVLTSEEDAKYIDHPVKVVVRDDAPLEKYIEMAIALLGSKGSPEHIVIGIDPGEYPGFVVLSNGRILNAKNLKRPEDVGSEIKFFLNKYSPKTCVIKIGNLGGIYLYRILKSLVGIKARVEIVNEYSTSFKLRKTSDVLAAIRIAMRSGKEINVEEELNRMKIPDGVLKDIQRKSRLISNGRVTISRELALRVALGELSINEAIEVMLKKKDLRNSAPTRGH